MSDDAKLENVAEDISVDEEQVSEVSEELVESDEVLDEAEELEEGSYGKMNAQKKKDDEVDEMDHGDEKKKKLKAGYHKKDEGAHEDDEEKKESAPKTPKTKAGVIQAAVDLLKAARKEDAQKMFAKMVKIDGEEDSIKSADDAMKSNPNKVAEPKAKAKVESIDFDEDLENIIKEEATLSDGFRDKASAIFEAVLTSKLSQEVERMESEYAQNLEDEVSEINSDLVEKVNSYLDYVVENWMQENELQVQQGLRTEIAEEFMTSLHNVFKEHYIEVPEGKVDLVDELNEQNTELESALNKTTDENISLHQKVQEFEKADVVREHSSGLAETEAEKLASLVEDIEFDNKESFEVKVKTVKESYFKQEGSESVDEVDSLLGDGAEESDLSDSMSRYTQAITKHLK